MFSKKQVYLAGAAACAWAALAAGEAVAQATADTSVLGEIVVTARKREESLQDVPVSISALTGEALKDDKIVNQFDLSMRVPSFKQTAGGVNSYTYIRGVGSGGNPSFEQAVATFVDGVYAGRGQQSRFPYYDQERVELLRGPQVALYGNSAIAGAISVISRKPGMNFEGDLTASYEFNHQETVVQGGVSIPVSDRVRLRLAGYTADLDEGWLKTFRPGGVITYDPRRRDRAGRIIADVDLAEDLDLELKYESYSLLTLGGSHQATGNAVGNPVVTEFRFDKVRSLGNGAPLNGKLADTARMNNQVVQATLNYDMAWGALTSVTAYAWYGFSQDTEGDMSPLPIFDYDHHEHYNQFSQEIRLTSPSGERLDYIVGLYFQEDDLIASARSDLNLAAQPAPFGAPLPPFGRYNYIDQTTKNFGAFFDANFKLTDQLKLNLAARYMHVKKDAVQSARASILNTNALNTAAEAPALPDGRSFYNLVFGAPHTFPDLELSESHFMPQVGLQYEFANGGMAYAKFVKGAKAGGFDWIYAGATPSGAKFLPEKATSYEIGYRGDAFDRRLMFGVTLYRTEVRDLQVSVFDGATSYVVGNAAEQRSDGVESDFVWRPFTPLTVSGSLGYSDAKYVSYPNSACYIEQRLATPAGTVCRQDLSGTRAPLNSKWTYNIGFTHAAELGSFVLTTRANYSYRTNYNLGLSNDPQQVQEGHGLLDGRIALAPTSERWQVAVFGKNLTNERYSDYGTDAPSVAGVRFRDLARPRQIGVELGVRF